LKGNSVIIGRGGQYVLNDFEDTYHILLMAKEEDRIKFIQDDYRVSRARTIQILKRMTKRRANLYSYFCKKDYVDPKLYDLVLNMSLLSIDKAEKLICTLIND
jgi:cytidylate kinase